jgi:Tat protein secretion system quality control protein TatD with DNase activity
MDLIDTHCHLDVEDFQPDREAVIARARAAGVAAIVVPAIHAAGWQGLLALCASIPGLHPALGLHPIYLEQHRSEDVAAIVLETDAPDLTVAAHRGERNSPEYLPQILATLAEVRQEDPAAVAAATTRNARELLELH